MNASEFPLFFETVHGHPPFPWQSRLAATVLESGRWPDVLDLPTASGKTSVLDIALFALAARPEVFPRRIVLVVDRRVVVDQGKVHADRVLERLSTARNGPLQAVADRLRNLWGGEDPDPPFLTQVLRGGMVRDDDWARRPDQPVVAVSTVDQVGSRLLFRGYGVSDRMAPVHAGLLGNDTLFFLDEVHLSVPFAETLRAIRERWRRLPETVPDRFGVVEMSATPGSARGGEVVFRLGEEDRRDPRLALRLDAKKQARLVKVAVGGDEQERKRRLAARAAKEALACVKAGAGVVAIVVNRVDTARMARGLLEEEDLDACLLTGRMRPVDRDRAVAGVLGRLRAGRQRKAGARPLVVVATQCIEAGADFDLDSLVTECASLDALRQRFGRLDRCGALGRSSAVVLARKDQVGKKADDPVYGRALARTWEWLEAQGPEVDFGVSSLTVPRGGELESLVSPAEHAPVLLPAHLDAWSQTGPRPAPAPEVSLWLHGPDRGRPEVQVVWRADVDRETLERARRTGDVGDLVLLLSACPPSVLEAMSLPIHAARRWLLGQSTDVADAPASGAADDEAGPTEERPALAWRGEESAVVTPAGIRPGDTLVVPAAYGGVRHGSFDPSSEAAVRDLGDRVQWEARRRATLRLHPRVLAGWGLPAGSAEAAPRVPPPDDAEADPDADIGEWLEGTAEDLPEPWPAVRRALLHGPARRIPLPGGRWILVARNAGGEVSTEDDGSSFTEREVPLTRHRDDVAAFARGFGRGLGLSEALTADLVLAAKLHDAGKADPRFQRMLLGGSEVRLAMLTEPIAKSAVPQGDLRSRREARRRAGYPTGYRHEFLSVAMASSSPALLATAADPDLVLHLVGSHHGWGRPFAPPLDHPEDQDVGLTVEGHELRASTRHRLARIDSGVADRYWRLVERYGWWGLAWLEAVLRLSDHRASEAEQRGEGVIG